MQRHSCREYSGEGEGGSEVNILVKTIVYRILSICVLYFILQNIPLVISVEIIKMITYYTYEHGIKYLQKKKILK
jgi:hypothetical protein